jgi:hypothetical protein
MPVINRANPRERLYAVRLSKPLKNMGQEFRLNSNSGISDADFNVGIDSFEEDLDFFFRSLHEAEQNHAAPGGTQLANSISRPSRPATD